MKRMKWFGMLCLATFLLTGCDKKSSSEEEAQSEDKLEIEYFGFQEEEDGPWGLMATDGTVLIKPKYIGYISPIINERFYVNEDEGYTIYTGEKNPKKIGTYKNCGSFTGDLCPVQDMSENLYYIDKDGKKVLSVNKIGGKKVQAIYNFFCGRAMVNTVDEKWGFIDEEGEPVIPIKYADAWNFCEDLAIVYIDRPTYEDDDTGKWCVIDTEGNKLFTKRFNEFKPSEFKFANGLLEVTDVDGNYHLLDKDGKESTKLKEKTFTNFIGEDLISVHNTEISKSGVIDRNGEWVLRPKFQTVSFNGQLLVACMEDDQYAIYSLDGEKKADLPEGYVSLFDKEFKDCDSYMLVGSWENGYKLIDSEGNEVKTKYDIHGYSTGYNWGFSIEEYEEEDYYEEAEEYDEEYAE